MLFSSNIFLFLFLPLYLALYFAADYLANKTFFRDAEARQQVTNLVLLLLSLFFYYWCSGKFILVFLLSILVNTALGRWIYSSSRHKLVLALGIVFNLGVLIYFKYFNFMYDQVRYLLQQGFHEHCGRQA